MQEGGEEVPKPLELFKTELASVLENNAAKLLESRNDKTDCATNSKPSQRKSSQSSLAKLFSSRSSSVLTITSNQSDTTVRSTEVRTPPGTRENHKSPTEEVQVKRKEYPGSKSLSSSETEDSDIQYSKLPPNGKSRFFVALPAMTKSREKTTEQPESDAAVAATINDTKVDADGGGIEFVRNVRGFGAQLRKSFFKKKPQIPEEKLGPLKQIRSDDDSSDSEPEDVTVFMPQTPKSLDVESAVVAITSNAPEEEFDKRKDIKEVRPKTKKHSRIFSRKNDRKSSNSESPIADCTAETVRLRDPGACRKLTGREEAKEKTKSKSNFYASDDLNINGSEKDAADQEHGLRQYFEEALSVEDPSKTPRRRHLSWFSRKRKSEKPGVVVATKRSVDIGTQFPEVDPADLGSQTSMPTNNITDGGSGISQEILWKVPVEDKEPDDPGMMFRCSSSHNDFPIHESDYVPGDSELTLSSLDVTEKLNTIGAPTYYGSNPKPARIPLFSACCTANATDLSVPYVKPNQKDDTGNKSPKILKERGAREHNPAMAIVKTVAKQVVDKLREREKKRKKTETVFYPMTQCTSRRWNSCMDFSRTPSIDIPGEHRERRKSL